MTIAVRALIRDYLYIPEKNYDAVVLVFLFDPVNGISMSRPS